MLKVIIQSQKKLDCQVVTFQDQGFPETSQVTQDE